MVLYSVGSRDREAGAAGQPFEMEDVFSFAKAGSEFVTNVVGNVGVGVIRARR